MEFIALIMIIAGVYFIVSGLREEYEPVFEPTYEDEYVVRKRLERSEIEKKTEVKGGGVILIGPIPIVFGDSRIALYVLMLTIALMVLSIIFILLTAGVVP
jgi:uncharacterized protein (TIGR00304 family)